MSPLMPSQRATLLPYSYKTVVLSIEDIAIIIVVDTMPLSPTPPAFSRSLEAFKCQLSLRDIEAFGLTNFQELRNAIDSIQNEQAHRRGYRNLNKIRPFLEFLQQYARVIEQFVSAKPDFLAFIWVSKIGILYLIPQINPLCWKHPLIP